MQNATTQKIGGETCTGVEAGKATHVPDAARAATKAHPASDQRQLAARHRAIGIAAVAAAVRYRDAR
jgi:hypothetical protein